MYTTISDRRVIKSIEKIFQVFFENKKKLKLLGLLFTSHSSFFTNQEKFLVFDYPFLYVSSKLFMIKCILYFFDSQIIYKRVIMMVFQVFHSKNLNSGF